MASSEYVTGAEFGRRCGVSRQAIGTATKEGRLFKDEQLQKYNIHHPVNKAYLENSKARIDDSTELEILNADDFNSTIPENLPLSMQELYRQKLEADLRRSEAQARKIELENALKTKELIPLDLVNICLGAFGTGIQSNFLTLGTYIGRGNIELRDRIEAEVTKRLDKTLTGAQMMTKQYFEGLMDFAGRPGILEEEEVIQWFKDKIVATVKAWKMDAEKEKINADN